MLLKNYDRRSENAVCYSTNTDGYTSDHLQFNQKFELLIIYDAGKYSITNNNTTLDLEGPAIFMHGPYTLHFINVSPGHAYHRTVIHFERQAAFGLFKNTVDFSAIQSSSFICFYPMREELDELMGYAQKADVFAHRNDFDPNITALFTALILNRVMRIHEEGRSKAVNESISYVQEALRTVAEDLSSQYTVEMIASAMNVSVSKFQIDFKRQTGKTYKSYLTDLRMTRARELLSTGSSIINASLETGYSSEAHFIKAFREYWGMTPGHFIKL